MPTPVRSASGIWHLNIRVSSDPAAVLNGTAITVPVVNEQVTVRIGAKVVLSLRTRDRREANELFKPAQVALKNHFARVRAITHSEAA